MFIILFSEIFGLIIRMLTFVELCYEFKAMDLAKEDNKQCFTKISRSLEGCECAMKVCTHIYFTSYINS
jgi:hypothetical protein